HHLVHIVGASPHALWFHPNQKVPCSRGHATRLGEFAPLCRAFRGAARPYESVLATIANAHTSTRRAPARFNAAAAVEAVAPLVITSSIRMMAFPEIAGISPAGTRKAPATLRRRWARVRPIWCAVARLRTRANGPTGFPESLPTSAARIC